MAGDLKRTSEMETLTTCKKHPLQNMSDEDSARNRKAGTSREGDEEKKNDETKDAKVPPKQDLYSRFVESFENALNSVTSTPTPCHYFIKLLEKKGILRRWFTQNIDSLEFLTGIPEDKIVTAHGSHRTSTCLKCRKKFDLQWLTERLKDKTCIVPKCDKCEGIVKPDITFFGENLPKRFFQCAISDFPKCDLLLIMGTSLVVQPFASMVNESHLSYSLMCCLFSVSEEVPRLLINKEEAGRAGVFERAMGIQGLCYGLKDNRRDVFWQGSCDDGCRKLAELLDWEHELDALIQEGEQRRGPSLKTVGTVDRYSFLASKDGEEWLVIRPQREVTPVDKAVELLHGEDESKCFLLDLAVLLLSRSEGTARMVYGLLGSVRKAM
ncbi:transcriptional regulator, Sir2 family [Ancylostoma ceylanicum]|uniref:Transcriptional regulator, Sir2 family n=2 Tax=Ancylostoma ceylanicum TaxID=53326 RepID=A0A0D6L8S5_9BILA|nr:transcriptional regulator, Sir2 family [Ancylostoma ceylanicum]